MERFDTQFDPAHLCVRQHFSDSSGDHFACISDRTTVQSTADEHQQIGSDHRSLVNRAFCVRDPFGSLCSGVGGKKPAAAQTGNSKSRLTNKPSRFVEPDLVQFVSPYTDRGDLMSEARLERRAG